MSAQLPSNGSDTMTYFKAGTLVAWKDCHGTLIEGLVSVSSGRRATSVELVVIKSSGHPATIQVRVAELLPRDPGPNDDRLRAYRERSKQEKVSQQTVASNESVNGLPGRRAGRVSHTTGM
jgi:hypothetical protein